MRIEEESNKDFGSYIKSIRLSSGKTLKEISEKSGISQSHIYRLEVGERHISTVTFSIIFRLAYGLNIPIQNLINVAVKEICKKENIYI